MNVYRIMMEALGTADIKKMIQAAYRVMKHPLIFTNVSYQKLTEIYPAAPQGDEKWDIYLGKEEVDTNTILSIFQHDYIEPMIRTRQALILDKGYFSDSPRLTAAVIAKGKHIGYVSMLCQDQIPSRKDMDALTVIADALAIFMQQFGLKNQKLLNVQALFAEKLIQGESMNTADLERWSLLSGTKLSPHYQMLTIQNKLSGRTDFAVYLNARIQAFHLPMLLYQEGERLHGILYHLTDKKERDYYLKQLKPLLDEYQFICGVSRSFISLDKIISYRRQSELALELGVSCGYHNTIYFYRDLTLTAIMRTINENLGYDNAVHPAISLLKWVDETRHTNYLETLQTYIESGFDMQDTCRKLNIHRNTLSYRLKRMEEMADIDLKDSETMIHLGISFLLENKSGE